MLVATTTETRVSATGLGTRTVEYGRCSPLRIRYIASGLNFWTTSSRAFTDSVTNKIVKRLARLRPASATFKRRKSCLDRTWANKATMSGSLFSMRTREACSFRDATTAWKNSNNLSDFFNFAGNFSDCGTNFLICTIFSSTTFHVARLSVTVTCCSNTSSDSDIFSAIAPRLNLTSPKLLVRIINFNSDNSPRRRPLFLLQLRIDNSYILSSSDVFFEQQLELLQHRWFFNIRFYTRCQPRNAPELAPLGLTAINAGKLHLGGRLSLMARNINFCTGSGFQSLALPLPRSIEYLTSPSPVS